MATKVAGCIDYQDWPCRYTPRGDRSYSMRRTWLAISVEEESFDLIVGTRAGLERRITVHWTTGV